MSIHHIQNLLQGTSTIVQHHQELARSQGAGFNLFELLGVGHYEVSTHSRMIGDLLNRQGSHGQGDVYLRLFFEHVVPAKSSEATLDAKTTNIRLEHGIGKVTETTGGRLDILLQDRQGNRIAIENKIYAGETENWVERYREFLGREGRLYYLTLDKSSPTQQKSGEDGTDDIKVTCISYQEHILRWLKLCREKSATVPIVRESLTQYIHLIQNLTNQSTNRKMSQKIATNVTADKKNLEAFFELQRSTGDIQKLINNKLFLKVQDGLKEKAPQIDFDLSSNLDGHDQRYASLDITNSALKEKEIGIAFNFDSTGFRNLVFGFCKNPQNQLCKDFSRKLLCCFIAQFRDYPKPEPTEWWPAGVWAKEPYLKWGEDVMKDILFSEQSVADYIINETLRLQKAFECSIDR